MNHEIKPAGEAFDRQSYADNALFFFDFDGVLADQDEDKIYRLPEVPHERNELEILASLSGIQPSLYPDTGYLRHLVYQSQRFDAPVKAHEEAVEFTWDLYDSRSPHFIITARSGLYAVERMMDFLRNQCSPPQEVFCLGRSSKASLLSRLREDWPERPFVYFEDTKHHINASLALGDPLLTVVEIEWPNCYKNAEALRKQHLGI